MNYAIILSGGIGTRMQMGDFPKQYLEVEKKPILLYTLEQFQKSSAVEKIVIVAADAWREKIRGWMEEDGITKFLAFADAGVTRQESIHNGLTVCMEDSVSENDGVIIHDGVRPLVSEQLIGDCLAALADHEGCMPVLPMKDTIYQSSDGTKIDHLLERSTLLTGILTSQVISNVPAAVLLSGFTDNWRDLLLGVDIGGLGTPIASLASLITLKLYLRSREARPGWFLGVFTLGNVLGLVILLAAAAVLFP